MSDFNSEHKLGTLYGYGVYIDLTPVPSHAKKRELEKAQKFFEQSFKHHDFIDQLKDIFKS